MKISIIIRTYNESKHLPALLESIKNQSACDFDLVEIVIVDSGSTDNTLEIAKKFCCRIVNIDKSDFTFGKSLNIGCDLAKGDYLVFISGHCIPKDTFWLRNIISPLLNEGIEYAYGRQIGHTISKFSECRHLNKYFPNLDEIPQEGYFCNNANSAISKDIWLKEPFNEELTGLEDMELAKRLVSSGKMVGYSASACVYHIHDESWATIKHRYEREAIALQHIMPEVQVSFYDFLKYSLTAVFYDVKQAARENILLANASNILLYRLMQYWGTYKGNHEHRKLSKKAKQKYYYPK